MPNNCLSVLYKRIIQVENKNVGLKVGGGGGGHKHTIAPPIKKVGGGTCPPCPPASYASVYIYIYIYIRRIVNTSSLRRDVRHLEDQGVVHVLKPLKEHDL